MASGGARVVTGSFTGSGAEIEIKKVGFQPRVVQLLNISGQCKADWLEGMADAAMMKTVDSGAGATDVSHVTSGGVTPLADGFKLGTDADLNAAGEVVHYACWD